MANSITSPVVLASYTNKLPPTETHGMPTAIPEISPSNQDSTIRLNQTVINASLKGVTTFFGEYMCLKWCGSGFSPGGSITTTHGGNPPRHVS